MKTGDGLNRLRKSWVELSLELAKLRAGVTQAGSCLVDFTVREAELTAQIGNLEALILKDADGEEHAEPHHN